MINVSIDTQTVEEAKREVINQLKPKINQACVEAVCREQYGIETITGYECKNGDIVIDNDHVAFKLDFEVRFPVSILINNGRCLFHFNDRSCLKFCSHNSNYTNQKK